MNKEELEKMFHNHLGDFDNIHQKDVAFDFIFETIIPEVLKSIIPGDDINTAYYFTKDGIKQKAKELYNIDL